MPILTARRHIGVAKEATWGTGLPPTTYVPFESVDAETVISNVVDEARRGNISKDYDVLFTTEHGEISLETNFYNDALGLFFLGLLGRVTTTGTTPKVHVFQVDPTPRSLSVQYNNGINETRFSGCVVEEVNVQGDAEGLVTVSVKMQSKAGEVVTATTPAFTVPKPLVASLMALTIDGASNTNLFGFDLTFTREIKLVHGANESRQPTKAVQGRIEVTGSLTFDVEDNAEYAKYRNMQSAAIVLTIANGASNQAKFTFSDARIESAPWDAGDENLRLDWEFRAVYNANDAGPCRVELTNATASY